ncbi:hypothetical protein DWB90_00360 [Staphylococcus chromogenes]|nr:hypothetical protein DWB90_00360 [Staphylococcus chromogenes]
MLLKGYLFQGLNMNEGNIEIVILLRIMGNHIVIALKSTEASLGHRYDSVFLFFENIIENF